MNDFVEKCLREWRRIGVPDAIANEMAADLDADLRDAAADDVAPEEVLGNGIFDAPSFARSWAAARGVIPPAPVPVLRKDAQRGIAVILAALAVVGIGLLTLVILHPAARRVTVSRAGFFGPGAGVHRRSIAPPGLVMQHPVGIGAPIGILGFGLLAIVLLAGGSWFLWRRT
jgi:hypothetical protein